MSVSDELMWKLVCREVHYVYRLFNALDEVIYVGITSDVIQRWRQHQLEKSWWDEVMRKEVWGYSSRDEAVAVEFALISSLTPKYNISSGQSPAIQLVDDGTIRTASPVRKIGVQPERRASHTSEVYAWIHQQLDDGEDVCGADVARVFPHVSRNGARMVRKVKIERESREEESYGEDEDPAEAPQEQLGEEDLEVHSEAKATP